MNTTQFQKPQKLEEKISAFHKNHNTSDELFKSYKRDLKYLLSKKGFRKIILKKIIKDESFFKVYAIIQQNIPNEIDNEFLTLIQIKLKDRMHKAEPYKLGTFKERILQNPDLDMKDQTIYISELVPSQVSFPCSIHSFSKLKDNHELELKMLPDNQLKFASQKKWRSTFRI